MFYDVGMGEMKAKNGEPKDLARYHRQMLLHGMGEAGQQRLMKGRVLLVGCGALGCVIADQLARAGVGAGEGGAIMIADRDYVERTNLQRQVLFDETDADEAMPKAEAARRRLRAINSQVNVQAVVDDIHAGNIERYAEGCDVLLDGTDNFETRYLINDVAVKHGIPYVYGGAVAKVGAAMVILPRSVAGDLPWEDEGDSACSDKNDQANQGKCGGKREGVSGGRGGGATADLRDVFEVAPGPGSGGTCDTVGVLASVVGMVASFQASEAIKILLGDWANVCRTMLQIDLGANVIRQIDMRGAYEASSGICSKQRRFDYLDGRLGSGASGAGTTLCGRHAVQIAGQAGTRLDLQKLSERLGNHGQVKQNAFMLQVELVGERNDRGEAFELTVFRDGRAMVKGTTDSGRARGLYAKYVGG